MVLIITHPGSAHVDDLLSVSLVIYKMGNIDRIERRKPTEAELQDPSIWKLDIGNAFDPSLKQFDHHQSDMNDCTLSLLLKTWNEWDRAIGVHKWLETVKIMDAQGPSKVIEYLNISRQALNNLNSFIEKSILQLFQEKTVIEENDSFFKLLHYFGEEFFNKIENYYKLLSIIEKKIKFYVIKGVPVIECLCDVKPSPLLFSIFSLKKNEKWGNGGIVIYQNDRPVGSIALKRFDDDERVDFNRIANLEKVIFIHKNGFFAVVQQMRSSELKQYIEKAIKD